MGSAMIAGRRPHPPAHRQSRATSLPLLMLGATSASRSLLELRYIPEWVRRGLDAVFKSRTGATIQEIHRLFFAEHGESVLKVLQVVVQIHLAAGLPVGGQR